MTPTGRVVILVLVISFLILLFFETDRRRGKVHQPVGDYYKRRMWMLSPYNAWARAAGKLPASPYYYNVPEVFPEVDMLRSNFSKIKDEALAIVSRGLDKPIKNDLFFTEISPDNWTRFYLKWYSKTVDPLAAKYAPFTTALISKMPNVKLAMFSVLGPHSKITPHRGPFQGALRYHLGLQCPKQPGCEITVDNKPYRWQDGHDIVFDDTYMHSVENNTDETRIILFCDILRPMAKPGAQRFNNWACDTFGPLTTRSNNLQEKVVAQDK